MSSTDSTLVSLGATKIISTLVLLGTTEKSPKIIKVENMLSRASHPINESSLMVTNNNISWLILHHMHHQSGKEKQRRNL